MRRRTLAGCLGAVVVLGAALVAVQAPARRVGRYELLMKARLRALTDSQDARRARGAPWGRAPAELGVPEDTLGVRLTIDAATDSGWAATARHPETTVACRLWVGRPAGAGTEGAPRCE